MQTTTSEQAEWDEARTIATRIRAGDRSAETALVERYGRGLRSHFRRKAGGAALAEDLWQETFRIALERLRSTGLDDGSRLAGFLHGIASNLLTAQFRRERRRDTRTDMEVVNSVPDPGAGLFADLSREQSARCVRKLLEELGTTRDREILRQYYIEERDKDEICAELGLDQLHFNRVLFRAKERFRVLVLRAEGRRHLGLVPEGRAGIGGTAGSSPD